MMNEHWREFLYPLGYLAAIAFAARFMLQWISSEMQQKSVVTRAFWQISLLGNVLLVVHSIIQMQFHVCAVQACSGVISWRNINLMQKSAAQVRFSTVILVLGATLSTMFFIFLAQGYFLGEEASVWFRIPSSAWQTKKPVSGMWHAIGFIGLILFSGRFWVQWWFAEKSKTSTIGASFWWLSVAGGMLSVCYFVHIDDRVNLIGPGFGLIPYMRNLMLLYKSQKPRPAVET